MSHEREITVPVAFGDLIVAGQTVVYAVRHLSWGVIRRQLWVERETRRRGQWHPYTFGDYMVRRRMRRWMATLPDQRGVHPWWRHRSHQRVSLT